MVLYLQTTQATKDTNCESVVTSGQHNLTTQHPPRDASPAGLVGLSLLAPFLSQHGSVFMAYGIMSYSFSQAFVHCRRDFSRISF